MTEFLTTWSEQSLRSAQTSDLIPQHADLDSWRQNQLQQFLQLGFPNRHEENWKYTSLAAVQSQAFTMSSPSVVVKKTDISPFIIEGTHRLVFINGIYNSELSQITDLPSAVVLTNTQQAIQQHPNSYREFGLLSGNPLSSLALLNGALMSDGLFLLVPAGIQIDKPIHILYLSSSDSQTPHMCHPRHIIQLQENSRATLIEDYAHFREGSYFNNIVSQIQVGENASLDYYKIQRESKTALHIANTIVQQKRDSQVKSYHIATGGSLSRDDLQFSLQQRGAHCQLTGFYFPKEKQLIDFHTRIDHFQSHTHSQQYYKGILDGQGRGIFNGKIIAHPYAQDVTAQQANHNLLLSNQAEIDTKPELEVYADNVKCTHGATVGKMDENALFYLQSRGISQEVAQHLLLGAFANEVIDRIPHQAISQIIREHVYEQI